MDRIDFLINWHTGTPSEPAVEVPESFEASLYRMKMERQERLNRIGLPRGF